ncbi:MAG: helix-turn-helix domain-containing protein [Candidatus Dormibacteraeota bacterium]|nr:helix-turn-helix domain-containing protein [Candidatus Dormibacteraeota bacterium]
MDPQEWFTPAEAAEFLRVSRSTIYRWGRQGRLRTRVLPSGVGRRFRRGELGGCGGTSRWTAARSTAWLEGDCLETSSLCRRCGSACSGGRRRHCQRAGSRLRLPRIGQWATRSQMHPRRDQPKCHAADHPSHYLQDGLDEDRAPGPTLHGAIEEATDAGLWGGRVARHVRGRSSHPARAGRRSQRRGQPMAGAGWIPIAQQ